MFSKPDLSHQGKKEEELRPISEFLADEKTMAEEQKEAIQTQDRIKKWRT